ncbi:MAG: helix-turn-helix domain-containing protein [Terriglobales bacterium]
MSSDICLRFGKRLRRLRKRQGWTQVYMAEHVGIDRSFISETGRTGRRKSAFAIWKCLPMRSA